MREFCSHFEMIGSGYEAIAVRMIHGRNGIYVQRPVHTNLT